MMYRRKTGCLLRASVLAACCLSRNLKPAAEDRLDQFASGLGLAFQVRDDVLDVEGDTEIIGKPQGSDEQQDIQDQQHQATKADPSQRRGGTPVLQNAQQ